MLLVVFCTTAAYSNTYSVSSGNWTHSNTWNNWGPGCGDTIVISSGHNVSVNQQLDFFSTCFTPMFIIIEGTLDFKSGKKIQLPCGSGVLVKSGGQIIGGNGGGKSNYLDICGTTMWTNDSGDVVTPTYFGELFTEDIISVTTGDWDQSSTWDCNCDPQFYHNAIVDTGHTVTLNFNTAINNLNIYGTLDATGFGGVFDITGNWLNTSTFVPGASTLNFQGTNAQLIDGNTDFNNVTLNNSAGLSINSGNTRLIGTLDLTLGNFATNNALTIVSDANGTGRIAELINGGISGSITMERYIDAGATDWRFITSAINGATLTDLNDDFITSGFPGSDYPLWPTAASPWPSIYYYDETQPGLQDSGFIAASSISNAIGQGQGIWVYCGDTIIGTQPFTIDITGAANTGTINIPLSYTNSGFPNDDGWNMVGNPYPSTLDWDDPTITRVGVNGAIYIWNPDMQQFGAYVGGIGVNGASNNIASSQAFWVQANSPAPVLTVTEASKTAVDGDFLKPFMTLPFKITATNSFGSDETAMRFESNASINFDPNYDAQKMTSVNTTVPRIASIIGTTEYAINQFPEQEITIAVKITSDNSGLTQIDFDNASGFGTLACLKFEDTFTGITYDLATSSGFVAYLYDTTTVARFVLHIGAPVSIVNTAISCFGNTDGEIAFSKQTNNPFDIVWKDVNLTILQNNTAILSDSISGLSAGDYYIETTDGLCGNRIDTVTIQEPAQITSYFTVTNDTIELGTSLTPTNQSANAVNFYWDFADGNNSSVVNPVHTYAQVGDYLVSLTSSQHSNCFEKYTKLITVEQSAVGVNEKELASNTMYIENNQLLVRMTSTNYQFIRVSNVIGQEVYSNTITSPSFSIDFSGFSKGMYVVTLLSNDNSSESFKIPFR